ncbi:MAG: sel1 repeat family protein [Lachnospiraceae bacterium]|nr:sel1 repeat family protein [Lachnospiraceae bacterium]
MERTEDILVLADGSTVIMQSAVRDTTNGIVFFFRDSASGASHLDDDQMAVILGAHDIALVTLDIGKDETWDGTHCREALTLVKNHFAKYDPWFAFMAEGRACGPLYECLQQSEAYELAYLFVNPWIEIRLPESFPTKKVRLYSQASGMGWEFDAPVWIRGFAEKDRIGSMIQNVKEKDQAFSVAQDLEETHRENSVAQDLEEPHFDNSVVHEATTFILRCFWHTRERAWECFSSILQEEDFLEASPVLQTRDLVERLLNGNVEAAIWLQENWEYLFTKEETEWISPEKWMEEEEARYLLLDLKETIRKGWRQNWPERFFFEAVAADKGHPMARRKLMCHLLDDLTEEEREAVLTILPFEAKEKHSYACVFLGLLAESGQYPYEKPEPETALVYYREAAALCDPEGNYRAGRLMEYHFHNQEEAFQLYRKASETGYPPSVAKRAHELSLYPDRADYSDEKLDLYEVLAEKEDLYLAWMRLARGREEKKDWEGAASAYAGALASAWDDERIEESWSYPIGNDREGVFLLDEQWEVPDITFLQIHLGKILYEYPKLEDDTSAAEYFQMAAEEALHETLEEREEIEACRRTIEKNDYKDPNVGEALYFLGECKTEGKGCEQNPAAGMACYFLAEQLGFEKAGEKTAFWKEAKRFLEESQGREADEEMRRKEAVYQLQMLTKMGLDDEAVEKFALGGSVCFAYEDDYGVSLPDPEDERTRVILDEIRVMEHVHDATAYLVQVTWDFGVTHVSVFFVAAETDEWEFYREQLLHGEPYVYAFDLRYDSDEYCADIGPIGIHFENGRMERVW